MMIYQKYFFSFFSGQKVFNQHEIIFDIYLNTLALPQVTIEFAF